MLILHLSKIEYTTEWPDANGRDWNVCRLIYQSHRSAAQLKTKKQVQGQLVLPERSPESALPYDADPVYELVTRDELPTRFFCNWRILKRSLGRGWLCIVVDSSSSGPATS